MCLSTNVDTQRWVLLIYAEKFFSKSSTEHIFASSDSQILNSKRRIKSLKSLKDALIQLFSLVFICLFLMRKGIWFSRETICHEGALTVF